MVEKMRRTGDTEGADTWLWIHRPICARIFRECAPSHTERLPSIVRWSMLQIERVEVALLVREGWK
jgi:hypothetical protein